MTEVDETVGLVELRPIFAGKHLSIESAGENLIFEFLDEDGFVHGFSFPFDVTEAEFISQMSSFIEYVT